MTIFLSLFLCALSIYLYKKVNSSLGSRLFFSSLVFIYIIFYLFYVIADYFTRDGINYATIFHLKYGLAGAGFLEYWKVIVISIILIILGFIFSYWIFKNSSQKKYYKRIFTYVSVFLLLIALFLNPGINDSCNIVFGNSIINEVYGQIFDINKKEVSTKKEKDSKVNNFYEFYKEPYIEQIDDSKNLVFIYAESLERTYFNKEIFPGLIKGLRTLQSQSTYFTNIKQVFGTGWTIAGMVSSQLGIPLVTPSHGNSMSGVDEFLPLATGLGDLLHKEGYHLAYYGGSSLEFAGKGKFYSTHKFDEIYGKKKILPKLKEKNIKVEKNPWGISDDSLFKLTYQRFKELSKAKEKFGLFLVTLETHHPDGHRSTNQIYKDGSNPMLNAVASSDYLITKFVKKIIESPYGKETTIVIASDHLAMGNKASHLLEKGKRRNLFMIIDPDNKKSNKIEKLGSTLDITPTILPFIGYKGAVGLGRNLTNEKQSETEIENIHMKLRSWEKTISNLFWNFPKIEEYIGINLKDKRISIDDRNFKIPILVEFNNRMETVLKFQFYTGGAQKNLVDHVLDLDKNKYFLLIDRNRNIKRLNKKLDENLDLNKNLDSNGFSLIIGSKNKYYLSIPIKKDIHLSIKEIKRIIGLP